MNIVIDILSDITFLVFILLWVKWRKLDVLSWVKDCPYKILIALYIGVGLVRLLLRAQVI